ncbi:MAG TPA: hypothetical protein PLV21_00025 [Cyclobacteriaceae bacterium]|nr:hypothetical protein [Cyclobacteriaceae bacterium]
MKHFAKGSTVWVIVLTFIIGCVSQKPLIHKAGGIDEAIQNCIYEFSTTKLFKKGKVFAVAFTETFVEYELTKIENGTYEWRPAKKYPDFFAVSIIEYNPIFPYDPSEIGEVNTMVPNVVLKKEGKLFYWWDNKTPLAKSTVHTLSEFKLLVDVLNKSGEFVIDDSKKGINYFICKSNLYKFSKKVTNVGLGYYSPPKINCN